MAINWLSSPHRKPHPLPAFKRIGGLLFWLAVGVVGAVVGWALMTAGAGE